VGGGYANTAGGPGSFVGGGGNDGSEIAGNTAGGNASTVGGGLGNIASFSYTTVGGGTGNTASGYSATVGGGDNNQATAPYATVPGGQNNTVGGQASTVGGGFGNIATNGSCGTVGGGEYDQANGPFATVPGGAFDIANGEWSFAAGQQAQALHQGAFVWADSQNATFASTGNDQFCVRAEGGVQLATSTSVYFGSATRQMLNLYSTNYGIGVQTDDMYFRTGQEFWWYLGGSANSSFGNAGTGGTMLMRLGSTGNLIIAGTLTQNSDRNVKTNFAAVDSREILARVAAMPMMKWTYKTEPPAIRHLGPMAQDFYAAFGLGEDERHITTVDEGGVALAAIQGLNQKLDEKDAEIEALKEKAAKVDSLEKRLAELQQVVQSLAEKK
jgi:hypothetical protein